MPSQATSSTARVSDPSPFDRADLSSDERRRIVEFGIGFDGRYYRYREYRYDRLADALNYAELDIGRSGKPVVLPAPPAWLEPHRPSEAERVLMERFSVSFDGRFYIYGSYRYDRCADALSYARRQRPDLEG